MHTKPIVVFYFTAFYFSVCYAKYYILLFLKENKHLQIHEVANSLNSFFTSVYTDEPISEVPTLSDRSNGSALPHIEIHVTHEDVLHQLNCLDPSKSCGPDKCHPRVLKNVKDGKKGDRKLPNNYHPISLTTIFCRMLEEIITDKIISYFIK